MQFSVASNPGKHWRNLRILFCKCKSKEVHPAWICQEAQNRCLASYPEIVGNSWKSNLIQFWWKLLQTWIKNRKGKSPDIFNCTFCNWWLNAFLCGKDSTNIIENALTLGILIYATVKIYPLDVCSTARILVYIWAIIWKIEENVSITNA